MGVCTWLGVATQGDFTMDDRLQQELFVRRWQSTGLPQEGGARRGREVLEGLPLFRLQTVLYPSCSILVKIFEPRYRRMLKRCLEHREPMGIVHTHSNVGTLAYVTEVYNYKVTRVAGRSVVEVDDDVKAGVDVVQGVEAESAAVCVCVCVCT
jgi:hypothetical protein